MNRQAVKRYRLKAGDVLVLLLVLAAAGASAVMVAGAGAGERGGTAVIEVNGVETHRFELAGGMPRRDVTVEGWSGPSTIEIEDGRVRMAQSTCRDKICVGHPAIDRAGSSIVCLPNRVVISIIGAGPPGVDAVTE